MGITRLKCRVANISHAVFLSDFFLEGGGMGGRCRDASKKHWSCVHFSIMRNMSALEY